MLKRSLLMKQAGYFVDSDIITDYQLGVRKDLVKFINNSGYKFLFTETTKCKFEKSNDSMSFPEHFIFVKNILGDYKKERAIGFFYEEYNEVFASQKKELEKIKDFENDLFIILEASFTQYGVIDIDIEGLLTKNTQMYKKLIARKKTRDILEYSMGFVGLDFLVKVNLIDDIIQEWKKIK